MARRLPPGPADGRLPGPQGRELSPDVRGVVERIEASLAAGGYKVGRDSVAGRQAVIGRRSHVGRGSQFVLVAGFKSDASREHLDRFVEEAGQYTRTVKGRLQRGARAVAVAVVDSAATAGDWAVRPVSGDVWPVLVDVGAERVVAPDGSELRALVIAHIAPGLGHPPLGLNEG